MRPRISEEAQSSDSEEDYGTATDGHSEMSTINSFPSDLDVPEDDLRCRPMKGCQLLRYNAEMKKLRHRPRLGIEVVALSSQLLNIKRNEKNIVNGGNRESKSDVQVLTKMLMRKIEAMGAEIEARLNEMQENVSKMVPLEEERRVRFAIEKKEGKDAQDQITKELKTLRDEIARVSTLQDEGSEDESLDSEGDPRWINRHAVYARTIGDKAQSLDELKPSDGELIPLMNY